jgi:YD repeat-containing protein
LPSFIISVLTSFTYNADGNLTNDGNHTYVYDAEDRLIGAMDKGQYDRAVHLLADGLRKTMTTADNAP